MKDFWKMVWENQSHAIVMLCLNEKGEDEREGTQVHVCLSPNFKTIHMPFFLKQDYEMQHLCYYVW